MTEEDLKAKNNTYIGGFMNFVKKGTEKLSISASGLGSNSSSSNSGTGGSGGVDGGPSNSVPPPSPNGTDLYHVFPGQGTGGSGLEEVQGNLTARYSLEVV